MDKTLTVVQQIAPIFTALFLGYFSRKKKILTDEGIRGLQQFVLQFCMPCLLFNSCLTATINAESVSTMVLLIPFMVLSTLWAFGPGKKKYPYHNFPVLFAGKESGSLGIPLFLILFGSQQVYRMGVLDLAQATTGITTLAIVSSTGSAGASPSKILRNVLTSPILVMSLLGLALNLTGIGAWLDTIGIGPIITDSTSFLGQPVSVAMIFSVGYNFSLDRRNRKIIFHLSALHFVWFAIVGILIQLALFLIPDVDSRPTGQF